MRGLVLMTVTAAIAAIGFAEGHYAAPISGMLFAMALTIVG